MKYLSVDWLTTTAIGCCIIPHQEANRASWISAGYEHFPGTPKYFSDRLPIALHSGSAHVVNYHAGYEELFQEGDALCWAVGEEAIIARAGEVLSLGRDYMTSLGSRAHEFARRHLTSEVVYGQLIEKLRLIRQERTK